MVGLVKVGVNGEEGVKKNHALYASARRQFGRSILIYLIVPIFAGKHILIRVRDAWTFKSNLVSQNIVFLTTSPFQIVFKD